MQKLLGIYLHPFSVQNLRQAGFQSEKAFIERHSTLFELTGRRIYADRDAAATAAAPEVPFLA